jgi:hypothetical protein
MKTNRKPYPSTLKALAALAAAELAAARVTGERPR